MNKIAALSTPIGSGAIAVVRMSGEGTKAALKKIFSPFPKLPNHLGFGKLCIGNFLDDAMLVYFDAPKSFSGEEMAELHLHGGVVLTRAVLEYLFANGFSPAQNGEFSKRAFVNGKMNLSAAEGIIDIINAESASALKAASLLSQNKLGQKATEIQALLTEAAAMVEATLDYPEEDLEQAQMPQVIKILTAAQKQLTTLLDTANTGRTAKYGLNIAIVGEPNVGKSSLFNALVGFDRAIVSQQQGTTRDTIEESIEYRGLKFNFIDTAGQRNAVDEVEKIGIMRAKQAQKAADFVVFVTDGQKAIGFEEISSPKILVRNKADLATESDSKEEAELIVSAKTGLNIEKLKEIIFQRANGQQIESADLLLTNERHILCFSKAADSVKNALRLASTATMDVVAAEIRQAWESVGQITGNTDAKIVVDEIFAKFCLGK